MFGYGSNLDCLLACCHDYRSRSSELWQLWCTWGLMFPLHAPQVSWSYCFSSCPQRDGLSSLMFCLSFFTVMLEFLTVSSLSVFGVSSLLSLKFLCHHKSCCIENVWISRWYDWSYFHMFYCVGLRLNLKMQHCMNECLQSLLSLKPNFIPRKKKLSCFSSLIRVSANH